MRATRSRGSETLILTRGVLTGVILPLFLPECLLGSPRPRASRGVRGFHTHLAFALPRWTSYLERERGRVPMDRSMVSVTQAANALGISRAAVHKAIQQRRLPAQRFGNVVLVDREAVARYKRGRGEAEGRSGAVESRRTERAALTAPGRDSRPSARSFHGSRLFAKRPRPPRLATGVPASNASPINSLRNRPFARVELPQTTKAPTIQRHSLAYAFCSCIQYGY